MAQNAEGNIHVAEERGQVLLRDNEDEEIQYSGVIRKKLNNHKKFTGFHSKIVLKQEKECEKENGLINDQGWEALRTKTEKKSKTQFKEFTPSQSFTSSTGYYKGGGTSQMSSTQSAYVKQVASQPTPTMKVTSMSFDPSKSFKP